jgi:hypothetical protein
MESNEIHARFSFSKIRARLRAGYQLWGSISERADIHRKNNYCVEKYGFNFEIMKCSYPFGQRIQ